MKRPLWYKLVGEKIKPCRPGEGFNQNRQVKKTFLKNHKIFVSTVFLGLDHDHFQEESKPILFETMVFGFEDDEIQERYHTWEEAKIGHNLIVKQVKRDLKNTKSKIKLWWTK